jgi:tetratricopeptide (TPR) repeat protein
MYINRAYFLVMLLTSFAGLRAEFMQQNQTCDSRTLFQQVNTLLGEKAYERAGKTLDQFRACPTRSPLETFQLGWLYGRARRFDTALKMFNAVPPEIPDRLTHGYAIALSKFELADYQGTIDILKPQQSSGIADAKSIGLLAVSYCKIGLCDRAYVVLTEQVQKHPTDLSAYLNLVTVCTDSGDFAKAGEIAAKARQLFPNSPDVVIVQGAANTILGHLDQAYEDFATGARLAPRRADARFFLALTDYKQGKFSDAIGILRAAINQGITESDLYYLMAECLLKVDSGDRTAAVRELDVAVDLNPDSVSARTLRGKLLLEAGRPNEAMTDLEVATHRDPESRAALYNLARAYRAVGKTSEAQTLFRRFRTQTADTVTEFSDRRLNEALGDKGAQQQ